LPGCGGGSSNQTSANPLTIQAGNWSLIANSTKVAGAAAYLGGSLTQSGSTITGMMHIMGSTCFDPATGVAVTGTVSGNSVSFSSGSVAGQVLSAKLSGTSSSLSGTYTINGGCSNGDAGNVAGTLVPSISGSWAGTIVSGSNTTTVTASLTQAATASSDGSFPVTGTLNFTGSPCSRAGSLANSFIAGPVVYVEAATQDMDGGTGHLYYAGLLSQPSTARSMDGAYAVDAGMCMGDTYTVSMTKQ
jgi:hypothetical protein